MLIQFIVFAVALVVLLLAAKYFTSAAEKIGAWMQLPPFVIGIFIVGIGTSLPELISGILSVQKGASEILAGNVIGSDISNILLITGLAAVINKKSIQLKSNYLYIDLHFLIGSVMYFGMIAYDGHIDFKEAFPGLLIYIIYSIYLIKGAEPEQIQGLIANTPKSSFPLIPFLMLLLAGVGIYFGAEYTVHSLEQIALGLSIPKSIVALTLLSLGTTLPELAVNVSAIRQGNAEMAVGNVLGSFIFNTLVIPSTGSMFGAIQLPYDLLHFSFPVMAGAALLFYLLTQDKKISVWEGLLFMSLYLLFILKTSGL